MKNMLKIIGIIVFIAIIGFAIVGCELNESDETFPGTWIGEDYEGDKIKFVFTDTTVTASYPDLGYNAINSTSYTKNGNVATFSGPGFTATCTISGKNMTVKTGGDVFATLTKQ